ncbi:hypothetical protein PS903_02991 [Pseudomonas fluorescens]|nr:hypothetical protein PS903_02991 [Pseudomonas fluorescens]
MANPTTPKVEAESPRPITYQDRAFTSRTLIMNSDRQHVVAAGKVTVSSADAEALAFLDSDPAFQRLPE